MSSAVATATSLALGLPSPAPRRHLEADLQRSIHQYLAWALPPDALHFAIPNGLMRSKKAAARAQGEAVRAGIPDLLVVHKGHAIFIELKAGRGTLSAAQRTMVRKLIYCGADVICARTLPDVEAALRDAGVPLRGRISI